MVPEPQGKQPLLLKEAGAVRIVLTLCILMMVAAVDLTTSRAARQAKSAM